ncbi:MAG: HlyD family efflux transporter periplasmic adaptor subunit [Planctomycetota bacterium]|nr:HlyD family efflux transporter periplasmic adaptor subunit [Planctomycetota bacterium]
MTLAELPRIRTPWKQQWRRIRYQLLPVVSMLACVLLTGWLWNRRVGTISMIGEAHVKTRDVVSPTAGVLTTLNQKPQIGLFDHVVKDKTIIAQLDPRPTEVALAVLDQERTRLRQELAAKQEELQIAADDRRQALDIEARRLATEVEELKLRVLDRRALIEIEKIELQRLTAIYDSAKELADRSALSQRELLETQLRRDTAAKRISGREAALAQAEAQRDAALKRLNAMPSALTTAIDKILEPLRTRILEHERRVQQLMDQIQSLTIISPLDGQISAIHRHPGEMVQPGDAIMTITDEQSHHIISYVREDQRIRPAKGMKVRIRSRFDGKTVESEVEEVGPRYAPIPVHHSHAKDPVAAEWGLPILIRMPPALSGLRPGELVEVALSISSEDDDSLEPGNLDDRD